LLAASSRKVKTRAAIPAACFQFRKRNMLFSFVMSPAKTLPYFFPARIVSMERSENVIESSNFCHLVARRLCGLGFAGQN
jgi:hypothetical protein